MNHLQKLKENEVFAVMDPEGNIPLGATAGQGLYFRDTRFLSVYEFSVDGLPSQLLSSTGELNFMSNLQFTNGWGELADGTSIPARTLSIRRNRFLDNGLHERIGIFNYNAFPVVLTLRLSFGCDFRHMFDIRSVVHPTARGWSAAPEHRGKSLWLRYTGLDGIVRSTQIDFDRVPAAVETETLEGEALNPAAVADEERGADPRTRPASLPSVVQVLFDVTVPARDASSLTLHIVPLEGPGQSQGPYPALDESFARILRTHEEWEASCIKVWTDHAMLNTLIRRSLHDLRLTINHTATGLLPVAGIPWFGVPFGRDSLITSLQTLSVNPDIAYGTLRFLAQYQGQKLDPWRDEEPGKILHELRSGELAALGEVPHTPYYASLDATPLFLYLVAQLVRWTGDWQFVASLGPTIDGALRWIEQYADRDGDGLVEYASGSPGGMRHHAWKDSHDAVQFPDGRQVEVPVAPVEVQAYCYGAELGMADLYRGSGRPDRADSLIRSARHRKERFEETFWMEDRAYYAQALDAQKVPVPAVTSNPGHCLLMDLIEGPRADAVAGRLMRDDMLSGWGVRTLSSAYPSFNPMSYHNGSIWPHDNSLIAAGLRHAGYDEAALRVIEQIFEAGFWLPENRLPELYCGFSRDTRYHSAPATYPTASSPQSWAAGSVFLMLQHLLGLEPNLPEGRIRLRPALLPWVNELHVERLRVGSRNLSIHVWREGLDIRHEVLGADGLEVVG